MGDPSPDLQRGSTGKHKRTPIREENLNAS
jgi:hypothetical protein